MSSPGAGMARGAFAVGDRIVIIDSKRRRYLVTLREGGEFHTHAGFVPHSDLVGAPEGVLVRSTGGGRYVAFRPTLGEFVLEMPRGAQVIYPKDLGAILMMADIYPGARVLESGVGSGALSMTMVRAGAHIVGYELRPDFATIATNNVVAFCGADALERYHVEERDTYEGIAERDLDRVVLDLAEPWRVVPSATEALRPGGIFLAYLPTINQTTELRRALDRARFEMAETTEVLHRTWHIKEQSVRPDHRMVAHTGFLTVARWLPREEAVHED